MNIKHLYFVQHGFALSKDEDPDRPLSATGVAQTQSVADLLKRNDRSISQVFHSGKLRAQQTADIFVSTLKLPDASAVENFSPNDDIRLAVQQIDVDRALYVGHLPHLEKLVSHLVCGDKNNSFIRFQNSAVIGLVKNDSNFLLDMYLTPTG